MGHGDGVHGDLLLGHYCGKSFIAETVTTSSEMAFMKFNAGSNSRRQVSCPGTLNLQVKARNGNRFSVFLFLGPRILRDVPIL